MHELENGSPVCIHHLCYKVFRDGLLASQKKKKYKTKNKINARVLSDPHILRTCNVSDNSFELNLT